MIYKEVLIKIFKLLLTNNPIKKFNLEVQLMLYFNGKNRFLRKRFHRRIYYRYNCEISNNAQLDESIVFVHPIAIVIGSNVIIEKKLYYLSVCYYWIYF